MEHGDLMQPPARRRAIVAFCLFWAVWFAPEIWDWIIAEQPNIAAKGWNALSKAGDAVSEFGARQATSSVVGFDTAWLFPIFKFWMAAWTAYQIYYKWPRWAARFHQVRGMLTRRAAH